MTSTATIMPRRLKRKYLESSRHSESRMPVVLCQAYFVDDAGFSSGKNLENIYCAVIPTGTQAIILARRRLRHSGRASLAR
jgi:hypothetical protein